jgi:uncharacterized protein
MGSVSATTSPLDCQRCGACCCNPPDNRRTGYVDYVQVDEDDGILEKPDLVRRFVVLDERDTPHLRLTPDGRCQALRGSVGGRVRCQIYHDRPTPCRRVEAGSELCHFYRRAQGLEA